MKNILITGASSGIGAATAQLLAAQGHRILLGARRTERLAGLVKEIEAEGGRADHQELDVTSLESMRAFAAIAQEKYGRIDVLVNNAGVMPLSLVQDLRVEDWNQMIDVNLRGTLHGVAAVLPVMREQGAGHIINVASVSAYRVDPTAAVYCANKFAVRALSEGLRQESREVRVTVVAPGFVKTELTLQGGDSEVRAATRAASDELGLPASAVAEAIVFAIAQPDGVDVGEVVVRSTVQG